MLLALAVSEWQQEREYEERASTELYNVHLELQSNQEVPTKIHDNNRQTIEKAQAADTAESEDLQFIPGVQVRSTAWQTLLAIGISGHIEYDLLLSLSETYSKQAVYRQTGMPLVDASMSMAAMASVDRTEIDDEIMQEQFMGCFNMIRAMEERLLESYQVSLALF